MLPLPTGRVDRRTAATAMASAPAVGLLLGGFVSAAGYGLAQTGLDPLVVAVLVVALLVLLTRGLHIDGLADTTDALASYADRDRALRIMASPEVGPLGVAAVVLTLLLEVAATRALVGSHRWWELVLALGIGRTAITWCCLTGVPAARPDGLGAMVAGTVRRGWPPVWWAILAGAALACSNAFEQSWWPATLRTVIALALVAGLCALLLRHLIQRLGGVTGDVMGALCELSTAAALIVLSAR
ncbi:MAG: adenosylcobinamide-GDP ribazoletransferase [Frankiales bacterium]|nr:adenosylcobinamide-GDP ribazoletransferase [Frankiales bacterium]